MGDPRVAKLARVLVRYSVGVKAGDLFQINAPALAAPLIRELYREALLVGAHPFTRIGIDGLDALLYKHGSDAQITHISPIARQETEEIDATISIMAAENTKSLSGADPQKVALRNQAMRDLRERLFARSASGELNWAITLFPTQAAAQDAEMSLDDYEDFVYGAGKLDEDDPVAAWQAVHDSQQRICDILKTKRTFRLVAPGTDLTYILAVASGSMPTARRTSPMAKSSPAPTKP